MTKSLGIRRNSAGPADPKPRTWHWFRRDQPPPSPFTGRGFSRNWLPLPLGIGLYKGLFVC